MPIEKVTAAQFAAELVAGINNRAPSIDTAYGPVPDAAINPQSQVLESQNDRVRKLSFLLALANADEFVGFESDLASILSNEGMVPSLGAPASATVVFSTTARPQVDAQVQRGFPVGTKVDESTGAVVTYVTTEARTMPAATAASFQNLAVLPQVQYDLPVPVTAIVDGTSGRVGAGRINQALRPLGAFNKISNPEAAAGGRDPETIAEQIERYLLAILGREPSTPRGVERIGRSDFPDVKDMAVVYGTNPLLLRAASDAGAVDVWIKGETILQVAENLTFLGIGQLIQITTPPLVSVVSVKSGVPYIEGSDYEAVFDTSGVSRSPRGVEGIRFLPGGPTALPAVGAPVTVTYKYENLVRSLQAGFGDPAIFVLGRDLLFRRGIEVPIVHAALLKVVSGFDANTVRDRVLAVDRAFINGPTTDNPSNLPGLELGDDVEGSDIQGVVRQITGVDNYRITRLTRATVPSGTSDIAIGDNEFPSLATADLSVLSF